MADKLSAPPIELDILILFLFGIKYTLVGLLHVTIGSIYTVGIGSILNRW